MENFKYFYRNQPFKFKQFLLITEAEIIFLQPQEQQQGKFEELQTGRLYLSLYEADGSNCPEEHFQTHEG